MQDHGIPVVVLFPEVEFDEAKFIARVDELVKALPVARKLAPFELK